jgi:predicted nucleic acid-binding protein
MAESLIDTNVIIGLLRGDTKLKTFLESLNGAIDTVVYVELIQGAKNKTEVARIEKALGQFPMIHFDESISRRTIDLIRTYSKSHGLLLGDAVIAATCLEKNIRLVTFNARDFRFIEGIKIQVPKS